MPVKVYAQDRPDLPPFSMPDRFRTDVAYFMSVTAEQRPTAGPPQPGRDYYIRLADAKQWLEDGVISLVSPLDERQRAEVELSEEQEEWLRWMVANGVERIRMK